MSQSNVPSARCTPALAALTALPYDCASVEQSIARLVRVVGTSVLSDPATAGAVRDLRRARKLLRKAVLVIDEQTTALVRRLESARQKAV